MYVGIGRRHERGGDHGDLHAFGANRFHCAIEVGGRERRLDVPAGAHREIAAGKAEVLEDAAELRVVDLGQVFRK